MSDASPQDVDAYIKAAPDAARPILRQLRQTIRSVARGAEETISYGMPHYHYHGRLAYFAAHKHHVGLYALGPADRLPKALRQYAAAKGTLRFRIGKPLPTTAIARLVKARAEERKRKVADEA